CVYSRQARNKCQALTAVCSSLPGASRAPPGVEGQPALRGRQGEAGAPPGGGGRRRRAGGWRRGRARGGAGGGGGAAPVQHGGRGAGGGGGAGGGAGGGGGAARESGAGPGGGPAGRPRTARGWGRGRTCALLSRAANRASGGPNSGTLFSLSPRQNSG